MNRNRKLEGKLALVAVIACRIRRVIAEKPARAGAAVAFGAEKGAHE